MEMQLFNGCIRHAKLPKRQKNHHSPMFCLVKRIACGLHSCISVSVMQRY